MKMVNSKDILNRANEIMDLWYKQHKINSVKEVVERGLINWDVAYEITHYTNSMNEEMYGVVFIQIIKTWVKRWKGSGTYFNSQILANQYVKDFQQIYGDDMG